MNCDYGLLYVNCFCVTLSTTAQRPLPQVTIQPAVATAALGDQLMLPCTVTGTPAAVMEVMWLYNGRRIFQSRPYYSINTSSGTLTVGSFSSDQVGNYTCAARVDNEWVASNTVKLQLPGKCLCYSNA